MNFASKVILTILGIFSDLRSQTNLERRKTGFPWVQQEVFDRFCQLCNFGF